MRINYKFFLLISFASWLASCNKKLELKPWSFDVTADSSSYNLGSNTVFQFSGNPDNITFYSGEVGKRYAFKDRTQADGIPKLSFTTAMNAGMQSNSLSLLVSTDFQGGVNGSSDPAAITAATWSDITNRANLATTSTAVSSGAIDLSGFAAAGKPVYLAFRYNAIAGSIQNKWTITNLSLRNSLNDGSSYVIDTLPTLGTVTNYGNTSTMPGWASKTIANSYNWSLSATSMVITGASTATAATAPAEAWVITGPVDLKKVTPDAGVVMKTMSEAKPSAVYTYATRGTFDAVFVARQVNVDKAAEGTSQLSITVK